MSAPPLADTLLRWLPADSRAGVQRRALIVWGVAAVIAVLQWLFTPEQHPLDVSLVYSYAISTAIWFLADPMRVVLRRWLRTEPPYYWSFNARSVIYQVEAIVLGYAIGTGVGDAYTGYSTWDLMTLSPERFWRFLFSSVGISAGFLFYFYQREKAHALQRLATESRLKLLESQLEPHMLFNTLANLRALITTDPERAVHMLDRLNGYLRATLRASRTDSGSAAHTLSDEFDRLRDYLELMAVRMGPRMAYELTLPDELHHHPLPPLLLQPLVENAIRHGLEPHLDGGRIQVRARTEGTHLVLEVIDTGVGMDASTLQASSSGFGLAQVRERVASLPGRAGRVEVSSAPGAGTTIRLHLPLALPHPTDAP